MTGKDAFDYEDRGLERLLEDLRPAPRHAVDPTELGQYAQVYEQDGPRSAAQRFPAVAEHLRSGCRACDQGFRESLELLALDDPESDQQPSFLEQVMVLTASLVRGGPRPALGLRGVDDDVRVVTYRAGPISVGLEAAPVEGEFEVEGVVAWDGRESAELAGGTVRLSRADGFERSASITTLATFHLAALPAGAFTIALRVGEHVVSIEGFVLE